MSDATRPNIVLILVDDMGFSDLGCYGSEIRTPNLDSLAADGQRFTHFYNAARCCPTRASLLTGLHPHQAGMGGMVGNAGRQTERTAYQGFLNDRCVTLAEVLGGAGYATYMSGKWHVGEEHPNWPMDRGFDRHFGLISGAMNYFDIRKAKAPGARRRFSNENADYTPPPEGFYATDAFTDYAVERIEQHDATQRPFFLYLAYTAPHWPLHALPEDIARYEGRYAEGWQPLREQRYRRLVASGLIRPDWALSPPDEHAADWESLDKPTRDLMAQKMAVYAAQVDRMDQGVGRVVDALRRKGVLEETVILFLSDNGACHEGGPLGFDRDDGTGGALGGVDSYQSYGRSWSNASNTPFRRHKHWVHEGGIATPLIVHAPGRVEPDSIVGDVGHVIDIMPTCCELAGARYPEEYGGRPVTPVEGRSLVPVFEGRGRTPHDILHWAHEGNHAIRAGKWKLVMEADSPWELYDMEADRTELNDLAQDAPELVAELREKFETWARKVGV
ncbi:MAG: arylsulfatase [Planctomycetota bacterium]